MYGVRIGISQGLYGGLMVFNQQLHGIIGLGFFLSFLSKHPVCSEAFLLCLSTWHYVGIVLYH